MADTLLGALVTFVAVAGTAAQRTPPGYRHADALAYALAAIAGASLIARRRRPLAVFAVTLGAMVVFAARGYPGGPALLSILIAVYTAASLDTRVRSAALGLTAGVGLSVSRLIFTRETVGSTTVNALGWIGAALFLGWAVANRRAFVAETRDRAVDAERLRVARELHDVVAHGISTINVQAGVAAHLMDSQPEQAEQALQAIKHLSKNALAELRGILNVLRAVDAPDSRSPTAGLQQLDGLISRHREAGIEVTLDIDGEPRPLPTSVDLAAYRIVQEALTNVLKHAGGAPATVALAYRPRELMVEVRDEGGRSQLDVKPAGAGYGLIGMRERAESVGGALTAGRRGDGFCVSAVLPTAGGGL